MKKAPLLHAELSQLIASFGHGDALVIADAGLPVPPGTRCVDLAVTRGVPSLAQVLDAVLSVMQVERAEFAQEAQLKRHSAAARAVVRTGECTPYANVALYAGVVF